MHKFVAGLMQRLDEAAKTANQNKLIHLRGVPKALDSVAAAQVLVKQVYEALGVEVDWDSVDPIQLRDAIRQVQQWKNGLHEGGSIVWEKGKPAIGALGASAFVPVAKAVVKRMRI